MHAPIHARTGTRGCVQQFFKLRSPNLKMCGVYEQRELHREKKLQDGERYLQMQMRVQL